MKDVLDSMLQPAWWVSVVIFGLLVNLLAAYLKPLLDKVFSSYSLAIRERVQRERRNREALTEEIISDRLLHLELKVDAIYFLIMVMFSGLLLVILLYSYAFQFGPDKEQFRIGTVRHSFFIAVCMFLFVGIIYNFKKWFTRVCQVVRADKKLIEKLTPGILRTDQDRE